VEPIIEIEEKKMGEECPCCSALVTDDTVDCESCGYRVNEHRLQSKVNTLTDANEGWQTSHEELTRKYIELIHAVETKYEEETRYETALRYIQEAEASIKESAIIANAGD